MAMTQHDDLLQVYRLTQTEQRYLQSLDSSDPLFSWQPIGPVLTPPHLVTSPSSVTSTLPIDLSADGSVMAYVDEVTWTPQTLEWDSVREIWVDYHRPNKASSSSGIQVGDVVALSADGKVLAVGITTHGTPVDGVHDSVHIYDFNGTHWTRLGRKLSIERGQAIQSLDFSPQSDILVVTTATSSGNGVIRLLRPQGDSGDGREWSQVGVDIVTEMETPSIALSTQSIAVTTYNDVVDVFTYNGIKWGPSLLPQGGDHEDPENVGGGWVTSVSLSLDGQYLAVGRFVAFGSPNARVSLFHSPEPSGAQSERSWGLVGSPLSDDIGNESPAFGRTVALSGDHSVLAVESGVRRNLQVHMYNVNVPGK